MKKILFVVNTMGKAGAETALLEFLKKLDGSCEIFLYVLMNQGEMLRQVPPDVHILNQSFSYLSVLTKNGRRRMIWTVLKAFRKNGDWFRKLYYIFKSFKSMFRIRRFQIAKLLWRTISDGSERFDMKFDLAVAWLEGASAYYVADHVKAHKKAAFLHIDYENAGYTREMDNACWRQYDQIFAVSEQVKEKFQAFYPEYAEKVRVFHNYIDRDLISRRAKEAGGFQDDYDGMRILTVGRLSYQKAYDIAIEAMTYLKLSGYRVRWYVLGEGYQRKYLEKRISELGLKKDFLLLGAVDNPYPYYKQTDIYVHATRYEGKSIAIQEAQVLGCAIIASDCSGNREQIIDGLDGLLCALKPAAIADSITELIKDEEKRKKLSQMAKAKQIPQEQESVLQKLFE